MKRILAALAVVTLLLGTSACAEFDEATQEAEDAASSDSNGNGNGNKNKANRRNGRSGGGGGGGGQQEAPDEPELTTAQENAIRSAENYISISGFSRTGLIEQLEFEQYSTEDATAAVDSLDIDYNEQAVKSAENYQDVSGFSRQGMIDQLKFEGYTDEQAAAGADGVGL